MASAVDPDPGTFAELIASVPPGVPVVMLNLLRFRDVATYPPGSSGAALEECSGHAAYTERYGPDAFNHVTAAGGEVVWAAHAHAALIAPPGEQWDSVLLVRYPSIEAFATMVVDPAYQAVAVHRTAALLDSRLIATVEND
ncbi:MAG: hypothetical protein WB767_05950 [Nocardioides sp.]